jgi:3-oxoacyl-[acyl-carrier-protein] synthase II
MGEGAGLLVIESLEHALARGAQPLAELVGYGTSADAYHLTAGPEDGNGARRAMSLALAQAGIAPEQVQHLNAHATSTPVGDLGELAAIKALFGTDNKIAVTSTKSAIGHLLGAAGGVEAIFTLLAIRDQIVPATLNFENPDPLPMAWTSSMVRLGRWLSNMRCPTVSGLVGSMPACCSSAGKVSLVIV